MILTYICAFIGCFVFVLASTIIYTIKKENNQTVLTDKEFRDGNGY